MALTPQPPESAVNRVPGPPQGLTSSDTLAWIQQYIEKDFAQPLSKDTVNDDDAKNCKNKAEALPPQSPPKPTVNHVPGPPQLLTPIDTQAWIQQYLEKDPVPTPPKDILHASPEVVLQETLISEPWFFASAATTPAAQTMLTSTFAQLPAQGETTARQQLLQDPLQDLQSKRMATATATLTVTPMATTTTTPTLACNNYNSDYKYSEVVMNATTGPASLRFSGAPQEVVAVAAADQTMTDARPQEQEPLRLHQQNQQEYRQEQQEQDHDRGGGATHAHASGHTGTDPALQVYLDRMQYLEERVLFLRESNDSLLGRIARIEKQTYW
jgi:hypothetical protein